MISLKHQEKKDEPVTIRVKIGLVKEVACSRRIGRWLSSNKVFTIPRFLHFKDIYISKAFTFENFQAVVE